MRPGIIKKTILSVGLFCLLLSILIAPRAEAQGVLTNVPKTDAQLKSDAATLKANQAKTSAWVKAGSAAYGAAVKSVLNTIAYDTATWIGSGGKGQKPQFITEGWGTYLSNVADEAAGTFIETLGKQGLGGTKFNLCEPNFDVTLKIGLGLTQYSRPKAPACSFSKMANNWKTAADKWKDMSSADYMQKAAGMFEPASNDIGMALTLQTGIMEDIQKKVGDKDKERSTGGGWLDVRNIGGNSQTAPNEAERQAQMTRDLQAGNLGTYTGEALKDAANIFLNQLAITAFNTLMTNLTASESTAKYKGDFGGLGNADSQDTGGGAATVEANVALSLASYKFTTRADYDILAELVMCPNPNKAGPTNCVITEKFMQAVMERKTVGEALAEGYLNKNGTFGFSKDGYEPKYVDESYPYRSLLILRKFRIIPVGWELGAQYIKASSTLEGMNLEKMVQCFDRGDSYEGYYENWCKGLVDPNWVLKAPKNYCKRQGFGPELLSNVVVGEGQDSTIALTRNENYCADEQSCIQENDDGSCQAYGYCVKEKRKWSFNAESCDAKYNTCQTFKSADGKAVSYLENTLDYSGCSADNAGCKAYSTQYDFAAASWNDQETEKIYLDRDAGTCDSKSEGCHEFIRTKPGTGANLLVNPSFEDDLAGTIWAGPGASRVEDAYDGTKSLQIAGNLRKSITFRIAEQSNFNVAGERFSLSLYAKGCALGNSNATFGIKDTSNAPQALSSNPDNWTRNVMAYVYPSEPASDQVTFEINNDSANCRIDAVKLERGGQATAYSDYRTDGLVYEKLLPDYLSNNSVPDGNLCYDERGALRQNAPAECSNFVRTCTADEVNCEMYTSATDGVAIPGKVTAQDYCAGECVGYDTYIQQGTTFDTSRYSYFIPSSAASCGAESAGCEEFTNLDAVSKGGEGVEYFSYLRQCVKPDATCGEFYTWEGSDETGYQLKVMQLQRDTNDADDAVGTDGLYSGDPEITSGDQGLCDENKYNLPSTHPSYNADCRQFYNKSGAISYHLVSKTVTCSENCFSYRMTRKNVDPNIPEAQCDASLGDRYWDSAGDGQCFRCENGGKWDSQQNACVYDAIPGEGTVCAAQFSGCREYSGNTGNNMSIVLNNDFEGSLQDWTAVPGSNASLSNDALLVGGRSLEVTGGSNPSAGISVGGKAIRNKSYVLSFIAKGKAADVSLSAKIGNASASTDFSGSSVLSQWEWRRFELNMIKLDHDVSSEEAMAVIGTGDFNIDDIKLTEITDRYYLIRDSWTTPDSCNLDENGNPSPLFALGCDVYDDRDNNTHYLHSFTHLCQDSAVGCELMIDTNNSTDYKSETTDSEPEVTVEADKFAYVVFDKQKQCSAIDKGCQRLGKPYEYDNFNTIYSDEYLKNDPDRYPSIICGSDAVQCGEWSTPDGNAYFRDPGDQVCEWRQKPATGNNDAGGLGWYKKKIKHCGGVHSGNVCTKDSDCTVGNVTSACILEGGDEPCPVSNTKTFGKGGYAVKQPTADIQGDNWAGICPTAMANCTEYIDPSSKFSTDLVAKNKVRLSPNTLYVFEGNSSARSCTNKSGGNPGAIFHPLGSNNKVQANGVSEISTDPGAEALVYVSDNSQDIYCSAVGTIRKAGVDYQDKTKIDTKTCNGMVDFDKGCVLFNERAQNGGSGMASFAYDSFDTYEDDDQSAVGTFPQSSATNNSNKILKVYPDRDCDEWLGCKKANDVGVCEDIAICTKLDENSACERFKTDEDKTAQMYSLGALSASGIADKSGYSKAASENLNIEDRIHPYPDAYYQFDNMSPFGVIANIPNGGFERFELSDANAVTEQGNVDYSQKLKYYPSFGWDGDPGNVQVLGNPVEIQNDAVCFRYENDSSSGNCESYAPEGRAILKVNASKADRYAVTTKVGNEPSVTGGGQYVISGYINVKNMNQGVVAVYVEEMEVSIDPATGASRIVPFTPAKKHNVGTFDSKDEKKDNWYQFFRIITVDDEADNIRISLEAEDDTEGFEPQGSYYFDDIKMRPTINSSLVSGSEWYTPQSCRLYPKEDSLSCDYYDGSGVRYKGFYGYCLEYDRYPGDPDTCLLWWPVPNINNNANEASELKELCGDTQANGSEECDCRNGTGAGGSGSEYCSQGDTGYYDPAGTSINNQYSCAKCRWTNGWCGDKIIETSSAYNEHCDWNEFGSANPVLNGATCNANPNNFTEYNHNYVFGDTFNKNNGQFGIGAYSNFLFRTPTPIGCVNNAGYLGSGWSETKCILDLTNCSDVLGTTELSATTSAFKHTRRDCQLAGGNLVDKNGVVVPFDNPTGEPPFFCKFGVSADTRLVCDGNVYNAAGDALVTPPQCESCALVGTAITCAQKAGGTGRVINPSGNTIFSLSSTGISNPIELRDTINNITYYADNVLATTTFASISCATTTSATICTGGNCRLITDAGNAMYNTNCSSATPSEANGCCRPEETSAASSCQGDWRVYTDTHAVAWTSTVRNTCGPTATGCGSSGCTTDCHNEYGTDSSCSEGFKDIAVEYCMVQNASRNSRGRCVRSSFPCYAPIRAIGCY